MRGKSRNRVSGNGRYQCHTVLIKQYYAEYGTYMNDKNMQEIIEKGYATKYQNDIPDVVFNVFQIMQQH